MGNPVQSVGWHHSTPVSPTGAAIQHLFTDASGSWGCGALACPQWFQLPWEGSFQGTSIAVKELLSIVIAAIVWGHRWAGQYVLCHSNNMAAVCQVNWLHARDPLTGHLLKCLAFAQAQFDFRIRAVHIPERVNGAADDLSRGQEGSFLARHSSAVTFPTQVPAELVQVLLSVAADWTSPAWRQRFSSFCKKG